MEDDSRIGGMVKLGLGGLGLGAIVAVVALPKPYGIWVGVGILVLSLLFFGGYFLWRRMRARRQSKAFTSAIEAQTAAAPRSISDPNQRAALDKLRQKFQTGMQEFKSRGKDIYKLPWYVIIGESGSGKTEAIRHSGIEFPPGLQDELQGSGGTVNMDWWFTNRGIILDTAGSMIFREAQAGNAPEWTEFLRLLKKARPHCPVNGLFLVLSIESLIKDSADKIAEKASRLAQQLDLIQRTLDVRFPVYLIVTKADLLIGFREFFDNIEDPLLQHQMFGWSNPEPLDSHFRPDLVEQHLKSVADRLRRRRLALLLRESASSFASARMGETAFFTQGGGKGQRRLDEVDSMFALPESIMRLVPRLRRYLETVFVAGEWSAKPVFLRGIYFTSSMREGKALDEAIALATGLSVDQLPEDRTWEKNRAFFLRDFFVEKVFRESGLVTRATNTIQLLRKRQFAIFGTAGAALLVLIVLAGFGYRNLKRNVLQEAVEWEAGAKGWKQGEWSPAIVRPGADDAAHYTYAGTNQEVQVGGKTVSVVDYHQRLQSVVSQPLSVSFIFKPLSWFGVGPGNERKVAQRVLFDHGVLRPLVEGTKAKLSREPNEAGVVRHQNALLSLIQLEADAMDSNKKKYGITTNDAAQYLSSFLSYLSDSDAVKVDTNLVDVFVWTYSKDGGGDEEWPPRFLLGGNDLTNNRAIWSGFEGLRKANLKTEAGISNRLVALNEVTASFNKYRSVEQKLLAGTGDLCGDGIQNLGDARRSINNSLDQLYSVAVTMERPLTNLARYYDILANEASSASALAIERNLHLFPDAFKSSPLYRQIGELLTNFKKRAAESVKTAKSERSRDLTELDQNYISPPPGGTESAYEVRWSLFLGSCSLLTNKVVADDRIIGTLGRRFNNLTTNALHVSSGLQTYQGAFAEPVATICTRIIGQNVEQLKTQFVQNYARHIADRLAKLKFPLRLGASEAYTGPEFLTTRKTLITGLQADLNDPVWQSFPASAPILGPLRNNFYSSVANGLVNTDDAVADMELVFTPPPSGAGDARLYTGFLRYLKIKVEGKELFNQDLSRFTTDPLAVLTNVPVNAKVQLEFYSNVDRTSQSAACGEENWLLPRLIQKDQAQRLPTSETGWKLRIPVTVNGTPNTLDAFSIQLKNPLPRKQDWPK